MTPDLRAALARGVGALARASGHGGTSLPGKVLLALDPHAIGRLGGRLPDGSVLISATNGKTTTAALAAQVFAHAGIPIVHNVAGANMAGGVASALLRTGRTARLGLFEVDEFWLAEVASALAPRAIVLSNLYRDQLDRYGELESIAERWAEVVAGTPATLVLAADDPLVADLGRERPDTIYFGIEDESAASPRGLVHAADSKRCRNCGADYAYAHVYVAHLGSYACPGCARQRPQPQVRASEISLDGLRGASFTLETPAGATRVRTSLPGLYNVYNALAAAALASAMGVALETIAAGLAATGAVFGRGERVALGAHELSILLVKNPAGANEVLRLLGSQEGSHDVLAVLNDAIADGRDVSWIWDADYETLAPRIRHVTCSGTRAAELALRLKYAGVPEDRITVTGELAAALDGALARAAGTELFALPTYTAMLALRELLVRRGHAAELVGERMTDDAVIWHDLECGAYTADLPFWSELARDVRGPVLDIGAGTGRVALALALSGRAVIALEREASLAQELRRRAGGLAVEVIVADACDFDLAAPVALAIVPMQTIHLLADRPAFLGCARRALAPGALLAVALLGEGVEPFEVELDADAVELDGVRYESAPTALRRDRGTVVIERRRSKIADGGGADTHEDVVHLHELDAQTLGREAAAHGLLTLGVHRVAPTREHAGSEIVLLGAPQ